jgi:hypothetical protein
VPTPMVADPFFSVSATVTPIVQGNAVIERIIVCLVTMATTPIVGSPIAEIDKEEEHVANHEEEQQQPPIQDVLHNEPPRRSQRARRSTISGDYKVYVSEEIQMEGDPTSFENAMISSHSSKWLEAMEDEIRSMSTNKVWDLEEIPK